MEVVWLLVALFGNDLFPGSSMRRRRFAASVSVVLFLSWAIIEVDRLPDVPEGLWFFAMAGVSCGLLGSLLLMRAPKNGRESQPPCLLDQSGGSGKVAKTMTPRVSWNAAAHQPLSGGAPAGMLVCRHKRRRQWRAVEGRSLNGRA